MKEIQLAEKAEKETGRPVLLTESFGKMLLKPGRDVKERGISMIIHGDPGTGKTSLIKTLLGWKHGQGFVNKPICAPEEILVIDVEAGSDSILVDDKNKSLVTILPVREDNESLSLFKKMVLWLHENDHPFKYIIVDNMSELEKFFLLALTKQQDLRVPRQKEWGDDAFYMRKYIRDMIGLTYKGINIILNFWSMVMPIEGMDKQMIVPMVMRSTTMEYVGLVEHCAYIGIGKDGVRFLQFESNDLVKCKTRDAGNQKGAVLQKFEEPDLANVFRKLRGQI